MDVKAKIHVAVRRPDCGLRVMDFELDRDDFPTTQHKLAELVNSVWQSSTSWETAHSDFVYSCKPVFAHTDNLLDTSGTVRFERVACNNLQRTIDLIMECLNWMVPRPIIYATIKWIVDHYPLTFCTRDRDLYQSRRDDASSITEESSVIWRDVFSRETHGRGKLFMNAPIFVRELYGHQFYEGGIDSFPELVKYLRLFGPMHVRFNYWIVNSIMMAPGINHGISTPELRTYMSLLMRLASSVSPNHLIDRFWLPCFWEAIDSFMHAPATQVEDILANMERQLIVERQDWDLKRGE